MSVISEKEATSLVTEIGFLVSSYGQNLQSLEEKEHILCSNASILAGYDGAKVAGSNRSEVQEDYTKYYYDRFSIKGANEIVSNSTSIMNETDRLQTSAQELISQMKNMDNSLMIIAIYISNIENCLRTGLITSKKPYSKMNILDKIKCANEVMKADKELNYAYLNTTAVLRNGNVRIQLHNGKMLTANTKYFEYYNKYGIKVIAPIAKVAYSKALGIFYLKNMNKDERDHYYYLTAQYHRDIMGETDKYGDNFKKLAVAPINKFTLEYTDYDHKEIEDSSWAAFYNNGSKDINIDMAYADASGENYHFQVETYSHELGHSYDHSIGSDKQFSLGTEEYADVFNQINKNDSEFEHIREYGHESPSECFAESTMLYYNNPAALKEIKIDGYGVNNLYEYMKNILE